jgi:hypothetical protein
MGISSLDAIMILPSDAEFRLGFEKMLDVHDEN